MISKEEFQSIMVGDWVLTTNNDEGTVGGWNHEKTEVLLTLKGHPLTFSTKWFGRHEIKCIIMPKIKFEELDMESLKAEDISIVNVKVGKDKSECDVIIDGFQVGERHVFTEEMKSEEMTKVIVEDIIKKRDLILESRKEMDEKIDEVKKKRSEDEDKSMPNFSGAKHQEIEELTKGAKPMKFESDEERLAREGLVRGTIVKRINAFNEDKGYGILTGEFKKSFDGLLLDMTDGSSFNEKFVERITDVNKYVLRTIEAEQGRILENAQSFTQLIQMKLREVIQS